MREATLTIILRSVRGSGITPQIQLWLYVALCIVSNCVAIKAAEASDPVAIQAAYLLNFAKYVRWPEASFTATNTPIVVGFYGKSPIAIKLSDYAKDKLVQGRSLMIKQAENPEALLQCHIVFFTVKDAERPIPLLQRLKDKPVLTVSDSRSFLDKGGMIRIFIEDNRMVFDVSLSQIQKAGLIPDPNMLRCAHKVIRPKSDLP